MLARKLFSLLASFAFAGLTISSPAEAWIQRLPDDPSKFHLRDVATDPSGNVLVGARVQNDPTFDFGVLKLDGAGGGEVWRFEIDGTGANSTDEVHAVATDATGDVFAAGVLEDATTFEDFTVVKVDGATGSELWRHQTLGSLGSDEALDLVVDAGGDVVAVGRIDGNYAATKLDGGTGTVLWQRLISGAGVPLGRASTVAIDSTGDVVVGGTSVILPSTTVWFVTKLDGTTGADIWGFTGPAQSFPVRDIAVDSNDDVVAVGNLSFDFAVIKLDGATGGVLWQHDMINPSTTSNANAVAIDASDDVIVVGTDDVGNLGDLIVKKLASATGAVLWQVLRDGTQLSRSQDQAVTVALEAGGDVFVGGNIDSDTTGLDAVVLRLDGATGAEQWIQRLDGTRDSKKVLIDGHDGIQALALDPSGDVVAVGFLRDKDRDHDFLALKLDADDGSMAGIGGTKLLVKDPGDPSKRLVSFLLKDQLLQSPPPATAHDPRTAGATIRIWNPTSLEEATFAIPPGADWFPLGTPAGIKGYRYRDSAGLGPCTNVTVLRHKKLKVTCKAKTGSIPFTLDEPSQGSLAISVQLGAAAPICAEFGGLVVRDEPGQFKSKKAPPLAACP